MDEQVVAGGSLEAWCESPDDDLPEVLKKNCLDPSL
jgi:hypothetical protein